jgi:ATP-binding cassette subfamily B protein
MRSLRTLYRYIHTYKGELAVGAIAVMLSDFFGLVPPWLIKLAIDHIGGVQPHPVFGLSAAIEAPIFLYSVLLVAAAALQAGARFVWRRSLIGISRKVEFDVRSDFFSHLQKLHRGFFERTPTGDIMSRSTNDVQAIKEFVSSGILIIVDLFIIGPSCLILMLAISPKLTVISILPLIVIFFVVVTFNPRIKERSAAVQETLSGLSSMIQEDYAGIRIIKAYSQEPDELARFKALNQRLREKKIALAKVTGAFFPLMVLMVGLSATLILWIGGREVIGRNLSLGDYMAFSGYALMFAWPLASTGAMISLTQRGLVSMERIGDILSVEPAVAESAAAHGHEAGPRPRGKVEFRSLSFAYDTKNDVLTNVSLTVPPGTILAITGPVGCGKSTLVKLIPRIYDPADGSIYIDDMDIKTMPLTFLRSIIGYVSQEPFLFSATVRENIVFGADAPKENELTEALRLTGLDKDLPTFDRGLDTLIGERGVNISGGQKQRIALARALIRKPALLILDEAFSNLDSSTEERVFANIRNALHETTIILVSHRISTVKAADTIMVMTAGGGTGERGTHEELLASKGAYQRIYRRQLLEDEDIIEEDYGDGR